VNELGLLQSAEGGPQDSLWEQAPGWRILAIAASVLPLVAVALPVLLPEQSAAPHATIAVPVTHAAVAATAPAVHAPVPLLPISRQPALSEMHVAAASAAPMSPGPAQITPSTMPAQPLSAPAQAGTAQTEAQTVCPLRQSTMAIPAGSGAVIGFFTPEQTQARVASDEARLGGTISPSFATLQRVVIRPDFETRNRLWISALPPGLHVALGDHVTYNTGYRDNSLPCSYVPTLITADQGPVQASVAPSEAAHE